MEKHKVVDPINGGRDPAYQQVLEQIKAEGKCPFCPAQLEIIHPCPILHRIGRWCITPAAWPYQNALRHWLLIGEDHQEDLSRMTNFDFAELFELVRWAVREFQIPGAAFCMRFGDTVHSGSSVVHLHAHLIVPEIDPATGRAKVVSFAIG